MNAHELSMLVLDATLKSALLLSAVWLVLMVGMRRSSAARRHLVWTAALCLCLLMPLLSASLPKWHILPGWTLPTIQIQTAESSVPPVAHEAIPAASAAPSAEPFAPAATPAEPVAVTPAAPVSASHPIPWQQYLLLAWAIGSVAFLAPILIGRLLVYRIRYHAWPASHLHPTSTMLLTSSKCRMPMAAGIVRPAIILPQDAELWDAGRLHSVIRHEAAHIRRHDCLWQTLGQLARGLYWPNPLVWMAHRQLLCEGEKACDDAVIIHGSEASAYAEDLLSIATSGRSDPILAAAAIAMARPTTLEGRLMSILDHTRNRGRVTLATIAIVGVLALSVAAPLSMIRTAKAGETPTLASDATGKQAGATVHLKCSANRDVNVPVFAVLENASPQISWEIPADAEPGVGYQGIAVTPSPRPDLKNIPPRQFWEMMNVPGNWSWCAMNIPADVRLATYGQKWSDMPQVVEWKAAQPLKTGYYVLWVFGYQGEFKQGEGRQPCVSATAVLKVGNPPEPAKLDTSKLTPEVMTPKLKEYVESFFASNYRDITARKTLEWGEAAQLADGNWSIRYKYEATIWNKDKVIQNKLFTFTPEGGFVAVQDVDQTTQPSQANLPPLSRREVNKLLAEFPEKLDLSTPELAWAAWQRASVRMDAEAIVNQSWVDIPLDEEKVYMDRLKQHPEQAGRVAKAEGEAKLIEVLEDHGELAHVICVPGATDRLPYHVRCFGRFKGVWKNLGEDAYPSLEEARAGIATKRVAFWQGWVSRAKSLSDTGNKASNAAPSVLSANPACFATDVDPQLKEIRVTFDRPMATGGFSFVGGGIGFPKTTGAARWVDETTCVLPVALEAGHDYWLSLNNSNFTNFRGKDGTVLAPYPIWFQTAGVNAEGKKPSGAPKVLKTEPAAGAADVAVTLTELCITFDQPMMTNGGFSWVGGGETFPQTTGKPHWIDDRTCVLPVKLEANHEYWFSANNSTFMGFVGQNGVPSLPYPVQFKTGAAK